MSIAFRGHWDKDIWQSVAVNNEYRLRRPFGPEQAVVDIGGHIGSFAYKALQMGAGRVVSCEPSRGSFAYLRYNLHEVCNATDRALLLPAAVWGRSPCPASVPISEQSENTGAANVISEHGSYPVACVPFTNVMKLAWAFGDTPLVKMDCEGSEWTILEHCLPAVRDAVPSWVGEYHVIRDPGLYPSLHLDGPRDKTWLTKHFKDMGYRVSVHQYTPDLGLFWAWADSPFADVQEGEW